MDRIGFVGLGRMGRGMASNLQRKGFALTVFDIHEAPMRDLETLGAKRAGSIAELVKASDIVLTVLPGSPEIEATVLGPNGLLANGRPGQMLLDMSTVDPATTDKLAVALGEREMRMVDAPIGRLASHADRGASITAARLETASAPSS